MKGRSKLIVGICLAAAAIAGGTALFFHFKGSDTPEKAGSIAYVDTVRSYMGGTSGMNNRFAGVVEAQETWSVQLNQDATVSEIFVTKGQEIKKGMALFKYDVENYQNQLAQSQIDLERLNNELAAMQSTVNKLAAEKQKAPAAEQANYTIQIEQQQLEIKQKQIDIQTKQVEITKLQDNISNAIVTSAMDGIVKSINDGSSENQYGGENDNAFITIMQTGNYRVKGTVNEQNIGELYKGARVIVYSRVDSSITWKGEIASIDVENTASENNNYYGGDGSANSSNYPFYVELDDPGNLMLGQHVYVELDNGQSEKQEGLWVYDWLIDMQDESKPCVWVDNGRGALEKRVVTLGEYNEDLMEYQVLEGLSYEDRIAVPDGTLEEGMATADMAEYVEPEDTEIQTYDEYDEGAGEANVDDLEMGDTNEAMVGGAEAENAIGGDVG